MQLLLMDEVSAYWKNSTQMTAIAIDRMMGYRLISNLAIVKWVFSPANVDQFHVSDRPWEVHCYPHIHLKNHYLPYAINAMKHFFCPMQQPVYVL
jgi:hypothetical protein